MPYFIAACRAIGTPYKAMANDNRNVNTSSDIVLL
jgi:hypothetical protein